MTIGKAISLVQEEYNKGIKSDNSTLRSRFIYYRLLQLTNVILEQRLLKGEDPSAWDYQLLPCVPLKKVSASECACVPDFGCYYYRTACKLPRPILGRGHMLKSPTTLDGNTSFGETTWEAKKYKKDDKYTSKKPDYFIRDDYLFLTSNEQGLKVITITGLFGDPVEAEQMCSLCEDGDNSVDDCLSFLEKEFNRDEKLIEYARKELIADLIARFYNQIPDKYNNAIDDTGQPG